MESTSYKELPLEVRIQVSADKGDAFFLYDPDKLAATPGLGWIEFNQHGQRVKARAGLSLTESLLPGQSTLPGLRVNGKWQSGGRQCKAPGTWAKLPNGGYKVMVNFNPPRAEVPGLTDFFIQGKKKD